MHLTDNIISLPGVGYKYGALLSQLGIETIYDLLTYFPSYYKDSSTVGLLSDLDKIQKRTVNATLTQLKNIRLRNGKFIQKGILTDGEVELSVTWFNQPYLTKSLVPPMELLISGKLSPKTTKPELISPEFEIVKSDDYENIHIGRIVPVYPLKKGVTSKWLRVKIKFLVEHIDQIENLVDQLPRQVRDKYKLLELTDALKFIHFPEKSEDITEARRRLGFDELLNIQKKLIENKLQLKTQPAFNIPINIGNIEKLKSKLPYKLTESQLRTIEEIHKDINKPHPMRRLLQGDVGSGKTIVALIGLLPVLECGHQVVLLAPTGILAQQHYQGISKLLDKKFKISLITKDTFNEQDSKSQLLIGTHAILKHKSELINNLAMVIIDEQHRFGVEQRRELLELRSENNVPHLLQLTATPIPRTVALTLFGDYQVSKIYPPIERKVVKTFMVPENKRKDSYSWIKDVINDKGQAFWIFPAIEESEKLQIKNLEESYPVISRNYLKNLKQMLSMEKSRRILKIQKLKNLRRAKTQILVSTTVVEVGIDIPGANLIVIESAERFGLAQLHQLRGRVGRKNQDAWCLLYFNESNEEVRNRLEFFAKNTDGIKIAEYDLNRRGPGEVYGIQQSGLPNLKIARFSNLEQLKQVKEASEILYKYSIMTILQSIILGIVQGITEFLPISSSAHLVLIPEFFNWSEHSLTFDIVAHSGTLLAILIYYRKRLVSIISSLFKHNKQSKYLKLVVNLLLTTIPTVIIFFLLNDYIENVLGSTKVIQFTLIIGGLLLLV
jgi:ATP-dependent DNA helicase RecG